MLFLFVEYKFRSGIFPVQVSFERHYDNPDSACNLKITHIFAGISVSCTLLSVIEMHTLLLLAIDTGQALITHMR